VIALVRQLVGRLFVVCLFPVMLTQAFALRRRALHFAPAAGPLHGRLGLGAPLHFLAIGDSIISGVGARRVERSTVGHLVRFMAGRLSREIHWRTLGIIGASAARVRHRGVPTLPPQPYDAIVVSVGVNDVLRLERSASYRAHLVALLTELRAHSPHSVIACIGLPPVDAFPKLRRPLRWIVGTRVRRFDAVARDAVAGFSDAVHVPVHFTPRPEMFADDGLHPSETSQRKLAKLVAAALTPRLASRDEPWRQAADD